MYNYPNYPSFPANSGAYQQNSNYQMTSGQSSPSINSNDNRFVGGFLGPFVLGGITGGLLAPAFYPRPNYYPVPPPPPPVYYYGPYYR